MDKFKIGDIVAINLSCVKAGQYKEIESVTNGLYISTSYAEDGTTCRHVRNTKNFLENFTIYKKSPNGVWKKA